ncbi:MAG TPA: hypothetical protein VNV88_03040, partial [Candidatus Solibacter sp.]|nr:hypothetical protein [Candidatus Solibacter sp.]
PLSAGSGHEGNTKESKIKSPPQSSQRAQGKPVGQNLGKAPGAGTERRNVWLLVLVWLRPCRAVVAVLT